MRSDACRKDTCLGASTHKYTGYCGRGGLGSNLQAGVRPVVVRALLSRDASG